MQFFFVSYTSVKLRERGKMYQGQMIVAVLDVCVILTLTSFPIGKNMKKLGVCPLV